MIPKYLENRLVFGFVLLLILGGIGLLFCSGGDDQQAMPEKKYVGSINSDKYHRPECKWAKRINPENEIWFKDKADAEAHGYVPCKVCNP